MKKFLKIIFNIIVFFVLYILQVLMFWDTVAGDKTTSEIRGTEVPTELATAFVFLVSSYWLLFLIHRIKFIQNFFNEEGTVVVNELDTKRDKDAAKKELIDLKEFLDLGIITQEEFDNKSKELKKIILDN